MSQRLVRYLRLGLVVSVFLAFTITLSLIPSSTIVEVVGAENAYLLMFCLGLVGGLTTFVSIPYHLVLMSLAAGGLNPILLGITTALGVMGGDSTMYFLCRSIKKVVSPRLLATMEQFARYLTKHPRLVTPGLFTYGAISPLSNDWIVATMSLSGYSYWRTVIPLALGNCVFNIAVAYLGIYAYSSVSAWF
jgi:uncharacterized membrane protein YdjX (TVP38/TMEM64 family)